jgi:hypothetical protein
MTREDPAEGVVACFCFLKRRGGVPRATVLTLRRDDLVAGSVMAPQPATKSAAALQGYCIYSLATADRVTEVAYYVVPEIACSIPAEIRIHLPGGTAVD